MARSIRFHLDEHCATAIAEGLRRRGIDVTTMPEAGLRGAVDEDQLAHAVAQERVIFTEDDDFLRIHAVGHSHAGIAYCHQHTRSIGEIIQELVLIGEIYDSEELANRVEFL